MVANDKWQLILRGPNNFTQEIRLC